MDVMIAKRFLEKNEKQSQSSNQLVLHQLT